MTDSTYDPATALHMAELCRLAYQRPDTIRAVATRPGGSISSTHDYRQMIPLDLGATQGVILANPKRIVIVWRGSEGIGDWRDDLRFARVRWRDVVDGRVHAGFKAQLRRAMPQLRKGLWDILSQDEYSRAKIIVTGHSLGGALATLTPLVIHDPLEISAVYSVEAPRPFNREAAEFYGRRFGAKTHRIVCVHPGGKMDIVPRVGPSRPGPWPLAWWHPVCEPQIHWDGKRYTSPEDWERVRAEIPVSPWESLRVVTNLRRAVSAHKINYVIETLEEQARLEKAKAGAASEYTRELTDHLSRASEWRGEWI